MILYRWPGGELINSVEVSFEREKGDVCIFPRHRRLCSLKVSNLT